MKTLFSLLLILSMSVMAQDSTVTLTWQNFYSDSLKTTRDTVDITWGSERDQFSAYTVTIYSSAADTVTVYSLGEDASSWSVVGLESVIVDAGTIQSSLITTTSYVKWIVFDPFWTKLRLVSEGALNPAVTYFTVSAY